MLIFFFISIGLCEFSKTITTNIHDKIQFFIWYDNHLQERIFIKEVTIYIRFWQKKYNKTMLQSQLPLNMYQSRYYDYLSLTSPNINVHPPCYPSLTRMIINALNIVINKFWMGLSLLVKYLPLGMTQPHPHLSQSFTQNIINILIRVMDFFSSDSPFWEIYTPWGVKTTTLLLFILISNYHQCINNIHE